jgi:hypothetical protein
VSDSGRLLFAALTLNSRANTGMSGCTQYNSANVANPAEKSASVV